MGVGAKPEVQNYVPLALGQLGRFRKVIKLQYKRVSESKIYRSGRKSRKNVVECFFKLKAGYGDQFGFVKTPLN